MTGEPRATSEHENAAPPVLETVGLGRSYAASGGRGSPDALASLDLRLDAGEALILVGGNGAGKSTALRLCAGIDVPTRGRVRVLGQPPRSMTARRRIGWLADDSELFPFLDWKETLVTFAGLANLSRSAAAPRIAALARRLDLERFGRKRVHAYSLGMRRRLAIASVLLARPALLVLDEPLTGLDPEGIRIFGELMSEEKARGAAILASSHHLAPTLDFADRLCVLRRGEVVSSGRLDEVARRLGARDLTIAGLDDRGFDALAARVAELGGTIARSAPSVAALERELGAPAEAPPSAGTEGGRGESAAP